MAILGYKFGQPVMMQLGSFQFGINTAAYQTLTRSTEWRWPSQDRFGKPPVLQHVGPGGDSITLPGVIYPEWRGGFGQVEQMRALAGQGEPLQLIDGTGSSFGRWAIKRIEENQSVFADAGAPRKIEFTLQLLRYFETDAAGSITGAVAGAVGTVAAAAGGSPTAAIPAAASGPVAQVQGLAGSVASAAKSLSGTLASAASAVQQAVAPITAVAQDAIGGVARAAQVASELQTAANRALAIVGKSPINITAISAAQSLSRKGAGLLTAATSASALLRSTSAKLDKLANVPAAASQAVRSAAAAAEKTAALCRQTATEAAKIKE